MANYYYMFFGREPSGMELRALETMFITYMEHGIYMVGLVSRR